MKTNQMDVNSLILRFRKGLTLEPNDVATLYEQASDAYYNSQVAVLEDTEFDVLKAKLKAIDPKNPLLAKVGAPILGERKAQLPYWMGSLDKIRDDTKAVDKWKTKYADPPSYVVSDKLDGNSAMLVLGPKQATHMYSRGDGNIGQDCSSLVKLMQGVPEAPPSKLVVRGEVILSRASWEALKHKGANARNVTAGAMNAKNPDMQIAKALEFVAYELMEPKGKPPSEGLAYLASLGFRVVPHQTWQAANLNVEELSARLVDRRANSPYEIDGIVVMHDAPNLKTVKGKNPKHAFAFKSVVTHEEAEIIVSGVEWNVSKDGLYKPIITFEPVNLNGVVIRKATGFNAAFITSNGIGIGARASLIRSGDVIPKITRVISPAPGGPLLPPDGTWEWAGETHVDIRVPLGATHENGAIAVRTLDHFVKHMDIEFVGRGILEKIVPVAPDIKSFMALDANALKDIVGAKNGVKIAHSIEKAKTHATCEQWMTASNMFGRGVGSKRIEAIVIAYPEVRKGSVLAKSLTTAVPGVGKKTLEEFMATLPAFHAMMKEIGVRCMAPAPQQQAPSSSNTKSKPKYEGAVVVFTGFRNKEWEALIKASGGKIAATVSAKTTLVVAKDPEDTSGKLKLARDLGVEIVGMDEFNARV